MRSSCLELIPFLDAHSRCVARTHLWSAILESSNTVPTVTVNWVRQSPQKYRPARWLSPFRALLRSVPPQWGQTGPVGQRIASRCLRAAFSSLNRRALRIASAMTFLLYGLKHALSLCVFQVYNSLVCGG